MNTTRAQPTDTLDNGAIVISGKQEVCELCRQHQWVKRDQYPKWRWLRQNFQCGAITGL